MRISHQGMISFIAEKNDALQQRAVPDCESRSVILQS